MTEEAADALDSAELREYGHRLLSQSAGVTPELKELRQDVHDDNDKEIQRILERNASSAQAVINAAQEWRGRIDPLARPRGWKRPWLEWWASYKRPAKRQEILAIAQFWDGDADRTARRLGLPVNDVRYILGQTVFLEILRHYIGSEADGLIATNAGLENCLTELMADSNQQPRDRMRAAEILAKMRGLDKTKPPAPPKKEDGTSLTDLLRQIEKGSPSKGFAAPTEVEPVETVEAPPAMPPGEPNAH